MCGGWVGEVWSEWEGRGKREERVVLSIPPKVPQCVSSGVVIPTIQVVWFWVKRVDSRAGCRCVCGVCVWGGGGRAEPSTWRPTVCVLSCFAGTEHKGTHAVGYRWCV